VAGRSYLIWSCSYVSHFFSIWKLNSQQISFIQHKLLFSQSLAIAAKIRMRSMFGTDLGKNVLSNDSNSPGGIAMETLLNIKTIASLNLERDRYAQFQAVIEKEEGKQFLSSLKSGSTSGFGILIQQW